MNGREIFVDTNILLYLLKGSDTLQTLLQGKTIYISFITELELIGFRSMTPEEEGQIQELLKECLIFPLNSDVKRKYVELRRQYHLKLADALIAATAITLKLPLITADKQFKTISELSLVAYDV